MVTPRSHREARYQDVTRSAGDMLSSHRIAAGWQRIDSGRQRTVVGQTFESSFVQSVSVDMCVPHGSETKSQDKKQKAGVKKHVLSSSLPNFRLAMSSLLLFCFCFSPPVLSAFRRLHRSDSVVLLSHAGLASHIWKTYSSRAPFSFALPRRVPPRGLPICARSRGAAREPLSVRLSACSASSVLVENSDYD